jgi:uncharacterized protein YxjI
MSLAKCREFLMREKWFSLRDKVDVMEPATQTPIGHFERKIWSIRTLYRLYDVSGENELVVRQKLLAWRPTFRFYSGNSTGEPEEAAYLGQLKKRLFTLRPAYWFEGPDGSLRFEVNGNFIGLKYEITGNGRNLGRVSKTLWAIRDTYGLKVEPGVPDQTALLLLGSVIVIHAIHEAQERRRRV